MTFPITSSSSYTHPKERLTCEKAGWPVQRSLTLPPPILPCNQHGAFSPPLPMKSPDTSWWGRLIRVSSSWTPDQLTMQGNPLFLQSSHIIVLASVLVFLPIAVIKYSDKKRGRRHILVHSSRHSPFCWEIKPTGTWSRVTSHPESRLESNKWHARQVQFTVYPLYHTGFYPPGVVVCS